MHLDARVRASARVSFTNFHPIQWMLYGLGLELGLGLGKAAWKVCWCEVGT